MHFYYAVYTKWYENYFDENGKKHRKYYRKWLYKTESDKDLEDFYNNRLVKEKYHSYGDIWSFSPIKVELNKIERL